MKIGISLLKEYDRPIVEVLDIVKEAGFDAVSPQWTPDVCEVIERAKELGLTVQSLHGPYASCVGMWRRDKHKSDPGKEELIEALSVCRKYNIPTMVTHIWLGFDYTFGETKYGLENYKEVVDTAREYGVKIAFENTEGDEYLDALFEFFKDDDTVGFCWDSGHENCYNRKDLLALYGDRLIMTHLNDNMSMTGDRIFWTDDLHMLPFDGTVDWDNAVSRLKKAKQQDIINFELKFGERYSHMSYEEYFCEAYRRGHKIVSLLTI
ncbi:MAG: sugar phosphate isomerase/epimerase [Clostridia bacterium]|nr:sugar phosphate isomerase/epimerase [Clostridia bacterium]